jgi:flagellar biosynthesis protein FlhF
MRLKSYFSKTVEAAMILARKELGDEALLINARPTTGESRSLGAYEVVFGLPTSNSIRPAAVGRMATSGSDAIACPTDPTLGRKNAERTIGALVGPPGSGKTTTLLKLAARYGLALGRHPRILTTDVFRIGAADQLSSLAALLAIRCDVVETPEALARALDNHGRNDLILIDTPGLGARDMQDGAGLAHLLQTYPEIDTHLVLPASLAPAAMARCAERFEAFGPGKLLFTHLDEAPSFEAIAEQSARSSLPISFLTNGQQIPEDLEEATPHRLSPRAPFRKGAAA